jgi:acyl dehydratase
MNESPDGKLYLEDLIIGQVFESEGVLVKQDLMLDFARDFDPQPFHLSREHAEKSVFGALAASGWHTAALTMRQLVGSVPLANGIIGRDIQLSWPNPTYAGDVLQVKSTVQSIDLSSSKPGKGMVTLTIETRKQDGKIVQQSIAKILVFARPNGT